MKKLRAGIIGLGRVASKLESDPLRVHPCSHSGHYEAHPAFDLVAGADIDVDACAAWCEQWGKKPMQCYADWRQMLEVERAEFGGLDVVSICAGADSRAEMVIGCAEAGVKAIWCEKAVATSMREARAMLRACDERGVHVVVNHPRRWHPQYREAQRLISDGAIGRVEAAVAVFNADLLHTGTHAFDVLRMLLGDVAMLDAHLLENAPEDGKKPRHDTPDDKGGHVTLMFEGGAVCSVFAAQKRYRPFYFEIIGSRGALRLGNDMKPTLFKVGRSREAKGMKVLRPTRMKPTWAASTSPQLDELLRAIEAGPGAKIESSLEDGAKALEIALACHASDRRRDVVRLPLDDLDLRVVSW